MYNLADKRVWVAGHNGMVGAAVCRVLESENCEILAVPRSELDLLRQSDVEDWCAQTRPDAVIVYAARVGGILASTFAAEFIHQNLTLETNIIHSAYKAGVEKLIFLGSSCIYPKHTPQPITEDALLTGPLEPTNEWYAIAKIASIKRIRLIVNNMVATLSRQCQRTFMGPATILTLPPAMWCRRCCASATGACQRARAHGSLGNRKGKARIFAC